MTYYGTEMIPSDLTGDLSYYGYILPSGFILIWIFQVSPSWRDRRVATAGLNKKSLNSIFLYRPAAAILLSHQLGDT